MEKDFSVIEKAQEIENVLVITNIFTKWTIAVTTINQTAQTVAKFFVKQLFFKFGICIRIHSDQVKCFEADIVNNFAFSTG